MPTPILPGVAHLDLATGVITEAAEVIERRLSDMPQSYHDQAAVRALLVENPVLYRVYTMPQPGDAGGWFVATSIVGPGRVGTEYFMTKGHSHAQDTAPEVYLTLNGNGMLLMQSRADESVAQWMKPGTIHYISAGWAHRTMNVGSEPLVFFAVWPVDAGHDYETYAERGFAKLILASDDGPRVVDNPKYAKAAAP